MVLVGKNFASFKYHPPLGSYALRKLPNFSGPRKFPVSTQTFHDTDAFITKIPTARWIQTVLLIFFRLTILKIYHRKSDMCFRLLFLGRLSDAVDHMCAPEWDRRNDTYIRRTSSFFHFLLCEKKPFMNVHTTYIRISRVFTLISVRKKHYKATIITNRSMYETSQSHHTNLTWF